LCEVLDFLIQFLKRSHCYFFPTKPSRQNLQLKSLIDYCSKTFKVRYRRKLDSELQIYALSNGINSVSVSLALHTYKRCDFHNLTSVQEIASCSSTAEDTGVVFDDSMSMVLCITVVCKSAFVHLRNITTIRKFLTTETSKTPVDAFVTSKIDYYNFLLYGAPKYHICIYMLNRLQQVSNCALCGIQGTPLSWD